MSDFTARTTVIAAVTDRTAFAESVRGTLELAGFSIASVSGAVLLPILPDHNFDLIILEWPGERSGGFELLRRVRQVSDIPAIALTVAVARILDAGEHEVDPVDTQKSPAVARVQAVLRRYTGTTTAPRREADWSLIPRPPRLQRHPVFSPSEMT